MNIRSLEASLLQRPDAHLQIVLPDGDLIPAEFHVTEVGHVVKRFIDCGGTVRSLESCLLQAWVSETDRAHRLTAGKLAGILAKARSIVPSDELDVEVEYDGCAVAQYKVLKADVVDHRVRLTLGNKQTDCLAREQCGVGEAGCGCGETAGKCC